MTDWIIMYYNHASLGFTIAVGVFVFIIKLWKKEWHLGKRDLHFLINMLLAVYAIPTAILLFIACFNVAILADINASGIGILIAGAALLYVSGDTISKFLK